MQMKQTSNEYIYSYNSSFYSQLLIKLQNENDKLRQKIKELSAQVEQALEKASKNMIKKARAKSPPGEISMVRDKEMMNQE